MRQGRWVQEVQERKDHSEEEVEVQHIMQCSAGWALLLSYLALSQQIISQLGSSLAGSWSDPQVLPDVAQLCLQGENLYKG